MRTSAAWLLPSAQTGNPSEAVHPVVASSLYFMRTLGDGMGGMTHENDIRVAEIRTAALAAGFDDMRVAWFSPHARLYSVDEFDRLASGRVNGAGAKPCGTNCGRNDT